MTFNFEIEEEQEAVSAINEAFPDYAKACRAIGQKISAAAAQLGPGPVTPIHASFKFSHIFATAKGIAFIDFDGANLGDPGYDLGRFIAHVYRMAAGEKIAPELAEQTVINFCASYNRAALSTVPQKRIDWFAACHLMRSEVYKSVKRMNPRLMSKLLEIADRLCPA
jgi:aminoglycoside phosphotransferase (APT) family kinase protein